MCDEVDLKVLKGFNVSEEWLTYILYESDVEGRRVVGRPFTWGLDGVKKACSVASLELRDALTVQNVIRL